jgi:hypothetical protein
MVEPTCIRPVNSQKRSDDSCLILVFPRREPISPQPVSPAVEQIRQTVEARIRELEPMIAELEQLEGILSLLDEQPHGSPSLANHHLPNIAALLAGERPAAPPAPAPAALPAAAGAPPQPLLRRGRRGTKPGRDGRAPQGANKQIIIAAILERPGITAPEIAERSGLKRTVVSATINRLKRTGELEPYGEGVRVPLVERPAVA